MFPVAGIMFVKSSKLLHSLLVSKRLNLSPFTKDFRGMEHRHHSTSPNGRCLYKVIEGEEDLYEVKGKQPKECSSRKGNADKQKREEHMNEKDMSTEGNQSTGGEGVVDIKPGQSGWKQFQCPIADPRFPREDIKQIWKECQYESFWYRALPLSAGSMAVTGSLIYSGVWKKSKRFGYFPKLLLAGIVGYAVGKASYVGTCREKFNNKLGPEFAKGFGPPGFGPGGCKPGHKHCIHVCEKCKKEEAQGAATASDAPTQS